MIRLATKWASAVTDSCKYRHNNHLMIMSVLIDYLIACALGLV